jgi:hypothetical protein
MASVFAFPLYAADEVDVFFLRPAENTVTGRVDQDALRNGGEAISGVGKLAQQFVLRLFTPIGGQAYEPREGSQFMLDVTAGRIRTAEQARRSFAISREEIISQFARDQELWPQIPDDERLAEIELVAASVVQDSVFLVVRIVSVAGQATAVTLPITFG